MRCLHIFQGWLSSSNRSASGKCPALSWRTSLLLILGCSLSACLPPLENFGDDSSDSDKNDTDTLDTANGSETNPSDSVTGTGTDSADTESETETATAPDSETATETAISDTGEDTETGMGVEDDIMPNIQGFTAYAGGSILSIQGGWYWYQSEADKNKSEESKIEEIYVTAKQHKYSWLGSDFTKPQYGDDEDKTRAEEIYAGGKLALDAEVPQYIALGFEVCSPQENDSPYEFPYTMGTCEINQGLPHADAKFLGIRFKISGEFTKVVVQFKQRGTEDDYQPYCVFYNPATSEPDGGDTNRCQLVGGEPGGPYTVSASVDNVVSVISDETPEVPVNLTMLQAIHFQVYNEPYGAVSFTLSDIKAFGTAQDNGGTDNNRQVEIDTACPDAGSPDQDELYDAGWVSPLPGDESDPNLWDGYEKSGSKPFDIMAKEVTVRQYLNCVAAGVCDEAQVNAWESCNVYLYRHTADDSLLKKSANCINWCQAKDFCRWIGGYLPSEEQWKLAARGSIDDDPSDLYPWGNDTPSCDYAVMNDTSGVGCGSVDRMPEAGCTPKHPQTATGICDMAGNLWEWVEDPYKQTSELLDDPDHLWQKGYKKIKGGSLNSKNKALLIASDSLEHPVQPHSPTRLGFRCARDWDFTSTR